MLAAVCSHFTRAAAGHSDSGSGKVFKRPCTNGWRPPKSPPLPFPFFSGSAGFGDTDSIGFVPGPTAGRTGLEPDKDPWGASRFDQPKGGSPSGHGSE